MKAPNQETLYKALLTFSTTFQNAKEWPTNTTHQEKLLVSENLNSFCEFVAKMMPKNSTDESTKGTVTKEGL